MVGDDRELSIFSSNNDDIIVEILSWLPVICLLRFRCVCKSWRALISTSHFVAKHRVRTNDSDYNKNVLILFKHSSRFPQLIDYQSLKKKKNVAASASAATAAIRSRRRDLEEEFPDDTSLNDSSFVGSCNGLICLGNLQPPRDYTKSYHDCHTKYYENRRLLLWNPSTGKSRKLPDMDWFRFGPLYYGFGYDSTTQDYKVLLGGCNSPDDPRFVAIFALKTASWKIVSGDHLEAASVEINKRGCFLNGALHWNEEDYKNTGTRIRSFDFTQEKFHLFSFIRHKGCTNGAGVGTIGNRLFFYTSCHIFTNHPDLEDAGLTIWVMMEYGVDQSWTLFVKIRSEIFPPNVTWLKPISHIEDDGEVLLKSSEGDLVLYIPKEEEDEEEEDTCRIVLGIPGIAELQAVFMEAVMYVETLVSPVTGDG